PALLVRRALGPTTESPATTVWNSTELLDVNVDQVTGRGVLVTALVGPRGLDPDPGGRIDPLQLRTAVTDQHFVHGGGVESQVVANPCRPPPPGHPQLHDPTLGPPRKLVRAAAGTAGPVDHPGLAELAIPVGPPTRRGDADREPLGRSGVGPALVDDEPGQPHAPGGSEGGVSVGHEDLRGDEWVRGSSTPHPEVFVRGQPTRRT